MPSIINATVTSGLTANSDTSGNLIFQTSSTNVLTLDSSQNATFTGNVSVRTSGGTYTDVARGVAKAWVNFDGGNTNTAGTINSSFNVTSVTVNSTGNFTVNMTNALTNTNYTPIVKGIRGTTLYGDYGYPADAIALTNSTFGVAVKSSVGTATTYYRVYAVVFA